MSIGDSLDKCCCDKKPAKTFADRSGTYGHLDILEFMSKVHATAKEKGWWDTERNFAEQLALMHSEISEVLEEYRTKGLNDFIYYNKYKPEGIAIEFADLIIRVCNTCQEYNIPLFDALMIKAKFNESRPYRHGGKTC